MVSNSEYTCDAQFRAGARYYFFKSASDGENWRQHEIPTFAIEITSDQNSFVCVLNIEVFMALM